MAHGLFVTVSVKLLLQLRQGDAAVFRQERLDGVDSGGMLLRTGEDLDTVACRNDHRFEDFREGREPLQSLCELSGVERCLLPHIDLRRPVIQTNEYQIKHLQPAMNWCLSLCPRWGQALELKIPVESPIDAEREQG